MFFKKCEQKHTNPCVLIALGMAMAFGVVAITPPGRKFIKSKVKCIGKKIENCEALNS